MESTTCRFGGYDFLSMDHRLVVPVSLNKVATRVRKYKYNSFGNEIGTLVTPARSADFTNGYQ